MQNQQDVKLLNCEAAGKIIGMQPQTIREYCRNKKIKSVKIGKSWMIKPSDLHEYANQKGIKIVFES